MTLWQNCLLLSHVTTLQKPGQSGSKWKSARKKMRFLIYFSWRYCSTILTLSLPLNLCTREQAQVLLLFDSCFLRVLPSQSTSSPASFLAWCVSSPGLWQGIFILLLQTPLTKTTRNLSPFLIYQIKVTFLLFPLKATEKLVPVLFFTCPLGAEFPAPVGTLSPDLLPVTMDNGALKK